jgi:quercetin dioxygenase-like cupin family protein
MIFRDFEDLEEYLPPGHQGVANRLLVGRSRDDGDQLSVWHGRFGPGGSSGRHVHEESLQIYVVLSGELTVGDGDDEAVLGPLGTSVIQAGSPHFIENRTTEDAEVLVVSLPALA